MDLQHPYHGGPAESNFKTICNQTEILLIIIIITFLFNIQSDTPQNVYK